MFPGVHLLMGSTLGIFAGFKFGPAAGFAVGLIAGLPTISTWNQPLPLGVAVYALEGLWVGFWSRRHKRGPLTAALSYWIFAGSWLVLAGSIFLLRIPATLAFIFQARSVINGLLAGLIVEIAVLTYEGFRQARQMEGRESAGLGLESLILVVFVTVLCVPILYLSTSNSREEMERTRNQLYGSSTRVVSAADEKIDILLQNYKRGVGVAASSISIIGKPGKPDAAAVQDRLKNVREQYPEFAGFYVADAQARIIAYDAGVSSSR